MATHDITTSPVDFAIDLDRKPDLDLTSFPGTHDVRAAVSPDCGFELLKGAIEAAQSELLVYIYNVSAEHILRLLRCPFTPKHQRMWVRYSTRRRRHQFAPAPR